jgi:hypothetical protein
MTPAAIAEVTLSPESPADAPATNPRGFKFILTFGEHSFSAAVLPDGSSALRAGVSQRVRLGFLVPAARQFLSPGREFIFREGRRIGRGQIVEVCDD